MAQSTWEKNPQLGTQTLKSAGNSRLKFLLGGVAILGAVLYLIVSSTLAGAQYFISVEELLSNPDYIGKTVRITGAVIGETIEYDGDILRIEFTVANLATGYDDLALALHEAVNDEDAPRLNILAEGQVKPDLLQHEAQAIMTGALDENGVFHATEILTKCPTRFIETGPNGELVEHPSA